MDSLLQWAAPLQPKLPTDMPMPAVPISKLNEASKEWAKSSMLSDPMTARSQEEQSKPASQLQTSMLAERLWQHEFQLQGLLRHMEQLLRKQHAENQLHGHGVFSAELRKICEEWSKEVRRECSKEVDARCQAQFQAIESRLGRLSISESGGIGQDRHSEYEARHLQHERRLDEHLEHIQATKQSTDALHQDFVERLELLKASVEENHERVITAHAELEELHKQSHDAVGERFCIIEKYLSRSNSNTAQGILFMEEDAEYTQPQSESTTERGYSEKSKADPHAKEEMLDIFTSQYTFQDSVWDAVLFAGFHVVGNIHSVALVFASLINTAMQLMFCFIIYFNMTDNEITAESVKSFAYWRATMGHDANWVSHELSLVSMVCSNSFLSTVAHWQFDFHAEITQFLGDDVSKVFSGRVSVNLCILVWIFAIMRDVVRNFKCCLAVIHQHTGRPHISRNAKHKGLEIKCLSVFQKCMFIALSTVPRCAISTGLCISGMIFLGYSREFGELLMNSVSLVFVLDLDELLYTIIVPRRVKLIKHHVGALSKIKVDSRITAVLGTGGEFVILFPVALIVAMLIVFNLLYLDGYHGRLLEIDHFLCGGELEFQYITHAATGIVLHAKATPPSKALSTNYQVEAVLALTGLHNHASLNDGTALQEFHSQGLSVEQVSSSVQMTASQLDLERSMSYDASVNAMQCIDGVTSLIADLDPSWFRAYRDVLRWEAKNFSVSSCQDVPPELCFSIGGGNRPVVRSICMSKCGCDNPWSGMATQMGCSSKCNDKFGEALMSLSTAPPTLKKYIAKCSDPPKEELVQDKAWQTLVTGFRDIMKIYTSWNSSSIYLLEDYLSTRGCEGVSAIEDETALDLCSGFLWDPYMRSVRMWCPASCACKDNDRLPGGSRECPMNACR